ncbi:MAG: hypothetical protein ACXABY_05715 [Candidatus Thorarchaeota archaeon]
MDFLNAVRIPTTDVHLAGKTLQVKQCPLLQHYELRVVARQLNATDPIDRLDATFSYIQIATGLSDISDASVVELADTLDLLLALNDNVELLPWQTTFRDSKQTITTSADYTNRELAVIVDTIASAYGWSVDIILTLQPEAAACYVQEIMLGHWEAREFQWKLSEVAFDKNGKYRSFPKPIWYTEVHGPTVEEAKAMVPARFIPDGVVVTAEDYKQNGKKSQDSQ